MEMERGGGVGRDGWYPLGAGRRKLLKKGKPGQAVIKRVYWMSDHGNESIQSTIGAGNERHDLTLEVHVDGRDPYEVQGLFRVPVRRFDVVAPGLTVPVKVHPSKPDRVAVDWDALVVPEAPTAEDHRKTAHDAMGASRNMMVDGWVRAAKVGAMTREQFDEAIDGAVAGGLVTAAEADEARTSLG